MPFPVPSTPTPVQLRRLAVRKLVAHAHAQRWADELLFLLGYNVHLVAAARLPPYTSDTDGTNTTLFVCPSPYAKVLRVHVEGYATSATALCTIDGAVGRTWVTGQDGGLNAQEQRFGYNVQARKTLTGLLDLSTGFTPGTITTVQTRRLPVSGESGLRLVQLCEVPLATTDVQDDPADEPGFNPTWALPPGRLVEALDSDPRGFARIFGELAKARDQMRQHIQWGSIEDTTHSEQTASTSYVTIFGSSYRVRVPRYYNLSTPKTYTLCVRYLAAGGCSVRVAVTPRGGSTTNTDLALSAAGVWTSDTSSTVDLPVNGTDQECDIELKLKATSGTAYVATLALIAA